MAEPTSTPLNRPGSCRELFIAFTLLALQGFGGVLAVTQRELVEHRRWLTQADFLAQLSLAQVLPGPNVVNLALILGDRWFGWRGGVAALAGLLAVPGLIVLALAVGYRHLQQWPAVAGALRGMGVVAAGLVVATALKLLPALRGNALGRGWSLAMAGLAFAAVALWHWPLHWVVLGLGSLALGLAYRRLGR